jgi:putative hydrolase of the HAD superfamily
MTIKINKPTLFIFDLDDTLYPEADFVYSAFLQVAGLVSRQPDELRNKMMHWFLDKKDVFSNVLKQYPDTNLTKTDLLQAYRNHHPEIKLNTGAINVLNSLKENAIPMVLVTDGRSITQRNKIIALGIESYFEEIIISEETGFEKREGTSYRVLQSQYPLHNVIAIGDNINKDFFWPKQFKWLTIGIRDKGKNIHSQEFTANSCLPDHYIDSFAELTLKYD